MMIFEGAISVKAAIQGKKRKVNRVFISEKKLKEDANFRFIEKLCRQENIEVVLTTKDAIAEMCSGKQHGGICSEVEEYRSLNHKELLKIEKPFIALLEGIEDPYNYGYALRSLYAAGCQGVISAKRDWQNAELVVCRSSAGASEFLPQYHLDCPDEILKELKYNGVDILCCARKAANSIYQQDFNRGVVICLGGEKRGLSAEIMSLAQQNIYIPYQNDFHNALNSASAVAVVAFEVYRQRNS